mgnify:CR=1 FL=1
MSPRSSDAIRFCPKGESGISALKNLEMQRSYEDLKLKNKQVDWEDVILLCTGMLRAEPRALAHVQQQYRFFTVDEYQDINGAQDAILTALSRDGEHANRFLVGDIKQPVHALAEFPRDAIDRLDGMNLGQHQTLLSYQQDCGLDILCEQQYLN